MASLTPGVLSKLLENAGNEHVKVTGEHRSALLQVIEIVPSLSLDDDPFRSGGFFLKLSDSLHSAYVSISDEDSDLIFSDTIQLGQFVYVSRFDVGSPVPVVCGLRVVPKRRPCVGSPKDLVSSDLLQIRPALGFSKNAKNMKLVLDDSKTKLGNGNGAKGLELRRLSLDSVRRACDESPTPKNSTKNKIAKESFASDKKDSSKHISSMKRSSISPMINKNDKFSSRSISMPQEKDLKSSTERTAPCNLVKVPLNSRTWFDQRISLDSLSTAVQDLGKEALRHRNAAFLAAVYAVEEASALDNVIHCFRAFADLRDTSPEVSAGSLVEQFLDLHLRMQKAVMLVNSLINRSLPEAKSGTYCGLQRLVPDVCTTLTRKNATSWVHAAIETDLSKFSLFRKSENKEIVNGEKYYYVILENNAKDMNSGSHSPGSKPSSRNHGSFLSDSSGKRVPSPNPTKQYLPSTKNMNPERKEWLKGGGLKEAAILAEKLILVSHQWFLEYLEESLNMAIGMSRGISDIACLLKQLKRVNKWLDDLVGGGTEADARIEETRKKLYKFLIENVDSTLIAVLNDAAITKKSEDP